MKWLIITVIVIAAVGACAWWFCCEMDKDMDGY
jgi:hypothetical protein